MNIGLTNSYHYFIKEIRRYMLLYESSDKKQQTVYSIFHDNNWSSLSSILDIYFTAVLEEIDDTSSTLLLDFYYSLLKRSLIFYSAFIVLLVASIIFIVGYIMKIIQRGIYINKKTLKFVPEHELKRKSINDIMIKIKY